MVIFHSYVSLPEGIYLSTYIYIWVLWHVKYTTQINTLKYNPTGKIEPIPSHTHPCRLFLLYCMCIFICFVSFQFSVSSRKNRPGWCNPCSQSHCMTPNETLLWYWIILDLLLSIHELEAQLLRLFFFPTCQVRVVRFYVSCLLLPPPASCRLLPPPASSCLLLVLLLLLNCDPRRTVFSVGPQPRPSMLSVPCRTLTTTIPAQCSLPDLNHDHPRPVFPAGPQPRPSTPSVPCRTSTTTIHAQCSLPDLNREHPRQVFPAGPQPRPSAPRVPCRTSTTTIHAQCSLPDLNHDHPRPVFPAGPQPRVSTPSVPCRTSCRYVR